MGVLARFEQWSNSARVAGWFCAVVAVGCGVFAVVAHGAAVRLRDDGERAVAEVVAVHDGSRDDRVVLRFRTRDGRDVEAEVGNYRWDPQPRVGDRQEVVYDPDAPADNVADVRQGPDFLTPWLLLGGCVLATACAYGSFTGRIDWRDWRR